MFPGYSLLIEIMLLYNNKECVEHANAASGSKIWIPSWFLLPLPPLKLQSRL
jgi:hemolysin-activating ACP:hemolysin acyltransferase